MSQFKTRFMHQQQQPQQQQKTHNVCVEHWLIVRFLGHDEHWTPFKTLWRWILCCFFFSVPFSFNHIFSFGCGFVDARGARVLAMLAAMAIAFTNTVLRTFVCVCVSVISVERQPTHAIHNDDWKLRHSHPTHQHLVVLITARVMFE